MSQGKRISRRRFVQGVGWVAAGATVGAFAAPRRAFGAKKVVGAGLGPPSNSTMMLPIIQGLKLGEKHGLDFKVNLYRRLGAMYADFAAHKWESVYNPAFSNAARFYSKGIPIQLMFTYTTANHAFVSKDPKIREAADLKGKTVAATTGSGFWGMAVLFLRHHGMNHRKDLNILSASPPAVATQLYAGKVDAGIVWEPNLSKMLTSGFHLVGDMSAGVRKEIGLAPDAPVWYLGAYGWKSWLDEDHDRNVSIMRMWQDAVRFYYKEPERADKFISAFTKIPIKALKYSREHKFMTFLVEPSKDRKDEIMATLKGFKSVGRLKKLPDDGIHYKWPTL
jgi:ABC-type nitrate/sulfonate/bicarbonate transport system substrate-binding protein